LEVRERADEYNNSSQLKPRVTKEEAEAKVRQLMADMFEIVEDEKVGDDEKGVAVEENEATELVGAESDEDVVEVVGTNGEAGKL
jgi:hypothetical protein